MPKKILTKQKSNWVKRQSAAITIKGTALNYPAGVQARYSAKLTGLTRRMTDDVEKSVCALFKTPAAKKFFAQDDTISGQAGILMRALTSKWESIFKVRARPLAQGMADQSDKASKTALHQSLQELSGGLSLKTSIMTGDLANVMKAVVHENVSLIKSIPQQYLTQVQGAVMRSISQGNGLQDLVPFFEKQKGISARRAKNIALDQTRKAYNGFNKGRMTAIGIDEYEWLHTGGEQKPRPLHEEMDGQIYSLKNPPVLDYDTGERGIPGQLVNCKCRMRPIVRFNEGVSQNGENG